MSFLIGLSTKISNFFHFSQNLRFYRTFFLKTLLNFFCLLCLATTFFRIFLSFIPMEEENVVQTPLDPKARERSIVRTSIIGILGNIILVSVKAMFGFLAGSIAIVMDALNNLTDALSSIITIIGTKLSGKAPDKKHPFGHGRIEYLTAMIIGVIILVAGFSSIIESIRSLIDLYSGGNPAVYENLTLIVISIAIVFKVALGIYFRYMGKKNDSDALKASGIDALSDSILSLSTLVCALIARFAGVSLEGYFGILIGLFILKSGFEVLRSSVTDVIGSRTESELIRSIKALIRSHPEVEGVYDLIVNEYGRNEANGSVHIQVKDEMDAKTIHSLTRKITAEVFLQFHVILTVGIYASNDSDPEAAEMKKTLLTLLKDENNLLQMHGFYVDRELKVASFDLIFNYDEKGAQKKCDEMRMKMEERYPAFQFYVNLDRDYTD